MISHLFIYPIKSLGAVSLSNAWLEKEGLRGDRRFMLVDSAGKFITQRTRPELTRFALELSENGFWVKDLSSGLKKELTWSPFLGDWEMVEIWDDKVEVREVLEGWSAWFSTALSEEVKLVRITAEKPRVIKQKYQTNLVNNTSFADSLPVLLVSLGSFHALEQRLGGAVDPLRFRPNIIVDEMEPFVEDTWEEIQVGTTRLFGAKPCARCHLVNVNPISGESDKNTLKTLASFRTLNQKVYFGQQFVPMELGEIQVGMSVKVIQSKDAVY